MGIGTILAFGLGSIKVFKGSAGSFRSAGTEGCKKIVGLNIAVD